MTCVDDQVHRRLTLETLPEPLERALRAMLRREHATWPYVLIETSPVIQEMNVKRTRAPFVHFCTSPTGALLIDCPPLRRHAERCALDEAVPRTQAWLIAQGCNAETAFNIREGTSSTGRGVGFLTRLARS